MHFARELLCEVVQDALPLLEAHFKEVPTHGVLDPQWTEYALLERLDRYVIFTARENSELVGYAAFYTHRHMHDVGMQVALLDVFYVKPDYRGNAPMLVRYAQRQLQAHGARHIDYHCPLGSNLETLLDKLGYEPQGSVMGIDL